MDGTVDIKLLITLGGVFASIIGTAAVAKSQIQRLTDQIKEIEIKDRRSRRPEREQFLMDKILRWWENTFGGNSAIWNLDYGKIIIIGLLLYHMFWQSCGS